MSDEVISPISEQESSDITDSQGTMVQQTPPTPTYWSQLLNVVKPASSIFLSSTYNTLSRATSWTGKKLIPVVSWAGQKLTPAVSWPEQIFIPAIAWSVQKLLPAASWAGQKLIVPTASWAGQKLIVPTASWAGQKLIVPAASWTEQKLIIPTASWAGQKLIIPAASWAGQKLIPESIKTPVQQYWGETKDGYDTMTEILEELRFHKAANFVSDYKAKFIQHLDVTKLDPVTARFFSTIPTSSIPFENFETEPARISQIKKIINALYLTENILTNLEQTKLKSGKFSSLNILSTLEPGNAWSFLKVEKDARQAAHTLFHIDIDLTTFFREEFSLFEFVKNYLLINYTAVSAEIFEQDFPRTSQLGTFFGELISKAGAFSGELDYRYLVRFLSGLPPKVQEAAELLQKATEIQNPQVFNEEKVKQLQKVTNRLLKQVEKLQDENILTVFKVQQLIYLTRNLFYLFLELRTNILEFNEETQSFLIKKVLIPIKFDFLPKLLNFIDKTEMLLYFKPGTFADEIRLKLSHYYNLLIEYIGHNIDFSKHPELLYLEDSRFLTARAQFAQQRIHEAQTTLLKTKSQLVKLALFEKELEKERPNKEYLNKIYRYLQPQVQGVHDSLDQWFIQKINSPKTAVPGISDLQDLDIPDISHTSSEYEKLKELKKIFIKQENTSMHTIALNRQLIQHIYQNTPKLVAHVQSPLIFSLNEPEGLNAFDECLYVEEKPQEEKQFNPEEISQFSFEQTLAISHWYEYKITQLQNAQVAFNQFLTAPIETLEIFSSSVLSAQSVEDRNLELKNTFKKYYLTFQPYFLAIATPNNHHDIDKLLCTILSDSKSEAVLARETLKKSQAFASPEGFKDYLENFSKKCEERRDYYKACAAQKLEEQFQITSSEPLHIADQSGVEGPAPLASRTDFAIKHTLLSSKLREIQEILKTYHSYLNTASQTALMPKEGVPYPEMKEDYLAQSPKVRAIKRIHNLFYHLEQSANIIEDMPDEYLRFYNPQRLMSDWKNLSLIVQLYHIYNELEGLRTDPYLSFLYQIMFQEKTTFNEIINTHHSLYSFDNGEESLPAWQRAMRYFYVLPEHLEYVDDTNLLSAEELQQLHERTRKTNEDIDYFINNSNSYIKLFLSTPKLGALLTELKVQTIHFANNVHKITDARLDDIQINALGKLLLKADEWEAHCSLKPGTVSKPLKIFLDKFYHHFLEGLNLPAQRHFTLRDNLALFEIRKNTLTENFKAYEITYEQQRKKFQAIAALYDRLDHSKDEHKITLPETLEQQEQCKTLYKEALPLITELLSKRVFQVTASPLEKNHRLDKFFNEGLESDEPKYTSIEQHIKLTYSYYTGLESAYNHSKATTEEQIAFIDTSLQQQKEDNDQWRYNYIADKFDGFVKQLPKPTEFNNFKEEYQQNLIQFLNNAKHLLVTKIKNEKQPEEINKTLDVEINALFERFRTENFKDYLCLQQSIDLIRQLKKHILSMSFLNSDDLKTASALILEALNFAQMQSENGEISATPVQARLKSMAELVHSGNFSKSILNLSREQTWYARALQTILNLLEKLGLYHPQNKKIVHQLKNKLSNSLDTGPAVADGQDTDAEPNTDEQDPDAEPNADEQDTDAKPNADEQDTDTDTEPNADEQDTDAKPNADEQDTDAKPNADEQDTDAKPNADEQDTDTEPNADEQDTDTEPNADEQDTDTEPNADEQNTDAEPNADEQNTDAEDQEDVVVIAPRTGVTTALRRGLGFFNSFNPFSSPERSSPNPIRNNPMP